jgi:oxygen-independent coproporphyrinogen-3 oxidase
MKGADVDRHATDAAVYVHIPFCSAVCPYCDFAVVAGAEDRIGRYIDAVIAEISMTRPWRSLDSIYFGGGTPSHVEPAHLGRILEALSAHHGLAAGAEVTLEANPEDFALPRAAGLIAAGFNRVSFGAQSFDDAVLARLGRRHAAGDIRQSFSNARAAGFENISLDLIFGTPVETDMSWLETLESAVSLEPDHVSCYALAVEPGTPLHREVKDGAPAPDPDTQADRYEMAERVLGGAGLARYEVSNWSRLGRECRYNLTVWAQGQYEAYGNGAHRYVDGVRSHNVRRLDAYIDRIEHGLRPVSGSAPVTGWDEEIDRLFVGLRRTAGVASGPGVDALLATSGGDMLRDAGVVDVIEGRLVVRRPLLTDEVHRQVLDLSPPQGWVEPVRPDNLSS